MMAAVFAMQGFGQLAGALVMLFVTLGFKESLLTARTFVMCTGICRVAVDKMWRVLVGMYPNPYQRLTKALFLCCVLPC